MTHSFNVKQFESKEKEFSDFSRLGDDYAFAHIISGHSSESGFSVANRFEGLAMILCVSGNFSLEINTSTYDIADNTLIVTGPNDIFRSVTPKLSDVDAYTLFLSSDFLRDVNIDINILGTRQPRFERMPLIKLSDDESALLQRYFELLHLNTSKNTESVYIKGISRNIIASIIYQLLQFVSNHSEIAGEPEQPHSRRYNYVSDFMRLVHKYYRQERSVGFYAGKLFISPKYLSLIIKEATGRSAAEWIDEFVILEAKNMLRFSGQNVQQIAYELNFSNQSSFGKYFKHLTGMSPTEFQRS